MYKVAVRKYEDEMAMAKLKYDCMRSELAQEFKRTIGVAVVGWLIWAAVVSLIGVVVWKTSDATAAAVVGSLFGTCVVVSLCMDIVGTVDKYRGAKTELDAVYGDHVRELSRNHTRNVAELFGTIANTIANMPLTDCNEQEQAFDLEPEQVID